MRSEPLDFVNAAGHRISARLDRPDGHAKSFALFAHCFTCDRNSIAAIRIARALTAESIAVLRFDFTGLGQSEGSFGDTSFGTNVEDLIAAADHMRASGFPVSLLIGHSLGGAAVLAAAGSIPEVKAVAVLAAPFSVAHVRRLLKGDLDAVARDGQGDVHIGGRPFTISKNLLDDLENHDQGARIARLERALLVMHSPLDEIVSVDNASEIFAAAKHPKTFVSLDDADHLLARSADSEYVARVVAAWSSRYVAAAPEETPPGDGAVRVSETGAGRFQVEVTAGRNRFIADEPVPVGGLASGPTPYELVSAGLGACTAMTLRLYSRRKGLPLDCATVVVRHGKQSDATPTDLFEREITLEGALDESQRARLLEIAEKCPVHRTLGEAARVTTKLSELDPVPGTGRLDVEGEHFADMDAVCREEP